MATIKFEVEKTLYFTADGHTAILSEGVQAYMSFGGRWVCATVVELRPKSTVLRSADGMQFVKRYTRLEAVSDKEPTEVKL